MNSLMNFVTDTRIFTIELLRDIRHEHQRSGWRGRHITLLGYVLILIAPAVIAYVRASV